MHLADITVARIRGIAGDLVAGRVSARVSAEEVESILRPYMFSIYGDNIPTIEPRDYSSPEQGMIVNLRLAESQTTTGAAESLYIYAKALCRQ